MEKLELVLDKLEPYQTDIGIDILVQSDRVHSPPGREKKPQTLHRLRRVLLVAAGPSGRADLYVARCLATRTQIIVTSAKDDCSAAPKHSAAPRLAIY